MEKHLPHYQLSEIKKCFDNPDVLWSITMSARNGARAVKLSDEDIVNVIQALNKKNFKKSMTSYSNHKIWHDVYNANYKGLSLYIKFTRNFDDTSFLLISFKAKNA